MTTFYFIGTLADDLILEPLIYKKLENAQAELKLDLESYSSDEFKYTPNEIPRIFEVIVRELPNAKS